MPSILLPGRDDAVAIPTSPDGKISIRELRKSFRLPEAQYRIIRKGEGNIPETPREDDIVRPNEVLRVVPKYRVG